MHLLQRHSTLTLQGRLGAQHLGFGTDWLSPVPCDCLPSEAGPGTLAYIKQLVWGTSWVDVTSWPTYSCKKSRKHNKLEWIQESLKNSWTPQKNSIVGEVDWQGAFSLTTIPTLTTIYESFLCICHCSKHLTCIILFNPYDSPVRCVLLLAPFYKWRNYFRA